MCALTLKIYFYIIQEPVATTDAALLADMQDRESKLQKRILKLTQDNVDLKCEVEQLQTDVPRLKVCDFLLSDDQV